MLLLMWEEGVTQESMFLQRPKFIVVQSALVGETLRRNKPPGFLLQKTINTPTVPVTAAARGAPVNELLH